MSIKPPATIRSALKTALLKPPFNLIFKHTAGLGTILMYHRISAKPAAQFHPNNFLEVDTATFEKQLCFLKEHCLCLPLGEIVDRLSRGTLPPGTAAITFDDGYRDNLELALPLLSKYQLPATIYATTNFLDGSASPWWHELEHILEHLPALEFTQHNQTFRFELTTPSEKIRAFEKIGSLIKSLRLAEREGLMRNIRNFCSLNFDSSALMLSWPELERLSRSPL
ncbi:MAG: polysaccharide deacetylase family protein, partial [Deltaproteobacteria bacterium]|nr:polysaccharide deacetylase family protein [Deltaproteobacteria bacterium]